MCINRSVRAALLGTGNILSAVWSERSGDASGEVDEEVAILRVFNILNIYVRDQTWIKSIVDCEVVLDGSLQSLICDVSSIQVEVWTILIELEDQICCVSSEVVAHNSSKRLPEHWTEYDVLRVWLAWIELRYKNVASTSK